AGMITKDADSIVTSDVPTAPGVQDFVAQLRPNSLYDQLNWRYASPHTPIAVQTVAPTAAFVGEGQTAGTSKWAATTMTLEPRKLISLVPATVESIRDSSIGADREITRDMVAAISTTVDAVMFSASDETAHAPRGLLYGVTPVVSAGSDPED